MNDIESRIHRGIQQITPDVFQRVLADDSPRLESEVWMLQERTGRSRNFWMRAARTAALAAACCVLVLGLGVYQFLLKVDSVVEIDVNPSLELQINSRDRVVRLNALNADGVKILDNVGEDLKHEKLDDAVCVLVDTMVSEGYLDQEKSSVLVSVSHGDEERSEELQLMVADNVKETLKEDQIRGVVYHQSYETSDSISELAVRYGISPGKACFIQKLILKRPDFTVEELAKLSISEITRLLEEESVDVSEYVAKRPAVREADPEEEDPDSGEEIRLAVNDTRDYSFYYKAENTEKPIKSQTDSDHEDSLERPAADSGLSLDGGITNVVADGTVQQDQNSVVTDGQNPIIPDIEAPETQEPGQTPQEPEGEDPVPGDGDTQGGGTEMEEPGDAPVMGSGEEEEQPSQWEDVDGLPEALRRETETLMSRVDKLLANISSMEPLEEQGGKQYAYETCRKLLVKGRSQYDTVQGLAEELYAKGTLVHVDYLKIQSILKTAQTRMCAADDYLEFYGRYAGIE